MVTRPHIRPDELQSWILYEDDSLLVVNKPGGVVCHPSKTGPWSSLVGACREYLGVERLHMPARLDRETSGVVVLVKAHPLASRLQRAMEHRTVDKTYFALLHGNLGQPVVVDQPIGLHAGSAVVTRRCVRSDGQPACTEFHPVVANGQFTLARVHPLTGRAHQIRVHAEWLGHPIVGDKMYGVPDAVFLDFLKEGLTPRLLETLLLPRHGLHAAEIRFRNEALRFRAPLPDDIAPFCRGHFGESFLKLMEQAWEFPRTLLKADDSE